MDDKIPAHPPGRPAPIAVASRQDQRHRRGAGAALIGIGLLGFIRQAARSDLLDLLFLPALGLIFLLWGSATRQVGLLLPGGVLGGVGLGALVADRLCGHVGDEAAGGLFLLCFALGRHHAPLGVLHRPDRVVAAHRRLGRIGAARRVGARGARRHRRPGGPGPGLGP